jgi:hypothetical protein
MLSLFNRKAVDRQQALPVSVGPWMGSHCGDFGTRDLDMDEQVFNYVVSNDPRVGRARWFHDMESARLLGS